MEEVAEIVETLARRANPNDRMARSLTRGGNHGDTRHDLALVVDHLQQAELLDCPHRARECLVRLRLPPIPIALSDQMTCVRKAYDALVITHRCHPSEVIVVRMGDEHMGDSIRMNAAVCQPRVKAGRGRA